MVLCVFGLGWMELLIIAGVISLFFGPAVLRRVVRTAQEVQKAKSDLTGPGALGRLLGEDEERDRRDERRRNLDSSTPRD